MEAVENHDPSLPGKKPYQKSVKFQNIERKSSVSQTGHNPACGLMQVTFFKPTVNIFLETAGILL